MEVVEESKGGGCGYVEGMGVFGGKVGKKERKKERKIERTKT